MTEDKTILPSPKKRYEWIDNARIIAALLIICVHMWNFFHTPLVDNPIATDVLRSSTYIGRVPFFLILAGYFLGRNITWHKAFDRAFWLLVPFVIWNILYYLLLTYVAHKSVNLGDFWRIFGIGAVFSPNWTLGDLTACKPAISVTWFLRDIIVLSLLTPFFVKFRPLVVVCLVVALAYLPFNAPAKSIVCLAPYPCFFYMLGTCLSDLRIDDAYRILNKRFTPIVVICFLAAIYFSLSHTLRGLTPMRISFVGGVFGALMIAHCGVLIETHLPKLSKRLAPCGPACFFVFVLHAPILFVVSRILPKWYVNSLFIWLLPIAICGFAIAIFLLMKKYTPWLMPYLGHMKMPKKQPIPTPSCKAP